LAELDISETNVSLLDFSSMTTDIKNLEVLNLFDCPNFTDSDFMCLFNQVGSVLKKLDLSFTNISFVHTGLLNISFLKLESIDLSLCCNLDDAGFFSFLNKVGGELKTLILRSPSISFVHVDSLTSSYPLMKSIDLSDCSNLNDYGFFSFLNKVGGELKTLTLRSTNISFVHTGSLNISFFKLESIDLPQCCNLDDAGFFSFLNKVGGGLKTLNLSFTNISFVHANSLTNSYPSIESIDLSYCSNLNDAGFFSFFNKMGGELKTLTLRSTDISFVHADSLTNSYPKIESIDLSDCSNLNDAGFFSFFNKVGGELKTLTLRSTNISFVHTNYLTYSYPKVESIDLSYCSNIDDAGIFTFLNKMGGELKTLNLSSTNISFVHANFLTNSYPKIESIDMSDCSNLDDAGFFSFFNKVGGELKTLTLRSTNISFVHADSLTNSYPKIESIDLWGCKNLDDAGFFSFFNKMGGELKTLKLSDTNISFVHTDSLTNCYPSIESIDLSYCSNLNDAGFFSCLNKVGGKLKTLILRSTNISFVHADSLTSSYPLMKSIDLSHCGNLNDAGFFSFLNKMGGELKTLSLRSTNISFVHADSLTNCYPSIELIDLSYCSNLNDAGIFSFLKKVGVELKSLGEAGYTFSLQKIGNE